MLLGGSIQPAAPQFAGGSPVLIKRAVEAVAVEVERISEGQRFVTQIMADRPRPPSIGAGPQ